jgi:hypothetical protein
MWEEGEPSNKTEEPEESEPTEGGKKEGETGSVVTHWFVILQVVVFGLQYRNVYSDPQLRLLNLTTNLVLCQPQNNINKIFYIMVQQCTPPDL